MEFPIVDLLDEDICELCEWRGYTNVARRHVIVSHLRGEWARDDDGDGIREVHSNTIESVWTTTRNSPGVRPLRGVHKRYLSGYIAVCEFAINLKRVMPAFISTIVTKHYF